MHGRSPERQTGGHGEAHAAAEVAGVTLALAHEQAREVGEERGRDGLEELQRRAGDHQHREDQRRERVVAGLGLHDQHARS